MDRKAELVISQETNNPLIRKALNVAKNGARLASALLLAAMAPTVVRAQDNGGWTIDQSRVVRVYTQCGGTGYPDNMTVMVQQVTNPDAFNTVGLGVIAGQCGNRYFERDSEIQTLEQIAFQDAHGSPIAVGTVDGRTFPFNRRYPQCGGSIGAMDIRPNYTVIVDEFIHPESGEKTYAWRTVGPQPGQCDNP